MNNPVRGHFPGKTGDIHYPVAVPSLPVSFPIGISMNPPPPALDPIERAVSVLMWDMAGTLIPIDPQTGHACALPGAQDFLPDLNREFRQVVTTGDHTADARSTLREFELLEHLEDVFGDLGQPLGKPHGAVLARLGGDPAHSLIIGDRLSADVAADTDRLVTILINQGQDLVGAGVVTFLIHILRKQGQGDFIAAFDALTASAEPFTLDTPSVGGGEVTGAWRRDDGLGYRLWTYAHPLLQGVRRIILL